MSRNLDETHDPARKSWVVSANVHSCAFPIQKLPYGVLSITRHDPIDNLRVVSYLKANFGRRHLRRASRLRDSFCFGDAVSAADLCLLQHIYNARRWDLPTTGLEGLFEIEAACLAIPGFAAASPKRQPDAD